VLAIARKELAEIALREGLVKSRLTIEPSDRLVAHVAAAGFDARFGARPMQRVLERQIVTPLARWLLDHRELTGRRLRLDLDAANRLQVAITGG
jgi:ATP-dependent Clp protease ATP-binding subunit ClpC